MSTATVGLRVILQDGAKAGIESLNGSLGGLGRTVGSLAYMWNSLTPAMQLTAITAAGAGVTFAVFSNALETAVTDAGDLQYALAQASLGIHGADQNAQQLQATVTQLGDQSLFSTTQVAQGFTYMGEKGQDATDIINYTGKAMIDLGMAIGSDTVPAATLLASTMEEFNIPASQAAQTADILTFAFYNGIPSATQLQQAINQVGAEAHLLNIPLQDLAITMDMLGQAGLHGSQIGTSLRYFLQSLIHPTTAAQKELADLGIVIVSQTAPAFQQLTNQLENSNKAAARAAAEGFDGSVKSLQDMFTQGQKIGVIGLDKQFYSWATSAGIMHDAFFTADGQFVGMEKAIEILQKALDNNFKPADIQGKANALASLFNTRGGVGANLLTEINNIGAAWNKMSGELGQTSAVGDANKLLDTFKGSVTELKTTVTSAFSAMGAPVAAALTPMIHGFNQFLSGIMQSHPEVLKLMGLFLSLGTGLSGVVFALTAGGIAAKLIGPQLKGVGGGFADMLKPLQGVAEWGSKAAKGLMGMGPKLWDGMFHAFELVDAGFDKVFGGAGLTAKLYNAFTFPFIKAAEFIDHNAGKLFTFDWVPGLIEHLKGLATGGFGMLRTAVSAGIPAILGFSGAILPFIAIALAIAGAVAIVILLFTKFKGDAMVIGMVLQQAFGPGVAMVMGTFKSVLKDIQTEWNKVQPSLTKGMHDLVMAFANAKPFFTALGVVIGFVFSLIITLLGGVVRGFIAALPGIIGFFSGILNLIGSVTHLIMAIFEGPTGWKKIPLIVLDIAKSILQILGSGFQAILSLIGGVIGSILGFFHHLFDQLLGHSIIPDIVHGAIAFFNIFLFTAQVIFNAFVTVVKAVFAAAGAVFDGFRATVQSVHDRIGGILGGIGNFFNTLRDTIRNAINDALGIINNLLNAMKNIPGVGGVASAVASHIPHFATGGIVTSPTLAMIGDGGEPEIVLPISKYQAAMQGAMASGQGSGNVTIPIMLDSRVIATATLNKVTGELQMNGFGRKMR